MCSTCDYKNYETVEINGKQMLENNLGYGSLVIRCDSKGENYKLAVKNEPKSEFTLYHCVTCGRKLF